MKTLLIALILIGFANAAFSQHVLITMKDSTINDVVVKSYTTTNLRTIKDERLVFYDMLSVLVFDYDFTRDHQLVTSLQTAKVRVSLGSKDDLLPITTKRYVPDSIRIAIMEAQVESMRINIGQFHQKHQSGTLIAITGAVITGVGLGLSSHDSISPVYYVGLPVMLFGGIKMIDSFKFLKRGTVKKR